MLGSATLCYLNRQLYLSCGSPAEVVVIAVVVCDLLIGESETSQHYVVINVHFVFYLYYYYVLFVYLLV